MMLPNVSTLWAVQLCETSPKGYPVNEEDVIAVLARERGFIEPTDMVAELIRQAILFAIPATVLREVVTEEGANDYGIPPMPPLPFPRVVIQALDGALAYGLAEDTAEDVRETYGVSSEDISLLFVKEIRQGEEWLVTPIGYHRNAAGEYLEALSFDMFRLFSDSIEFVVGPHGGKRIPFGDLPSLAFPRLAVEAVHLITARGVELSEGNPDRALLRRVERAGTLLPEHIYWVEIRDRDSQREASMTPSEARVYHCRWLVRGHWRRFGTTRKTWIRPYVKGPAGAPWRGRPVYHVA